MTLSKETILENRYRIDGLLAQGGMGAIYQGYDTNLNIPVAIKENFFQTPQGIEQFKQEAMILARLRHPTLPRVIHHFSFDNKQYLVMDYIEGKDLWEIVKNQDQPLSEAQALRYIIQVCEAVEHLHQQQQPVIHRDIKPQNIKITPANQAVLVDFGIAKVAKDDSRTRTGAQAITPGFSPPEQYSGSGTTPASDIYALGATLYAILVGKKPPDSISRLVKQGSFERPELLNKNLSYQVSEAIMHAMESRPEDRPASVAAWKKELRAVQEGLEAKPGEEETLPPGASMPQDAEATLAGTRRLPSTSKFWLVDSGGLGYPIGEQPLLIGRHAEAEIVIQVLSASREHAFIRLHGGQCQVRDNNSANGTFVNGKRIASQWRPLDPGDKLAIGTARFTLTDKRPQQVATVTPRDWSSLDDRSSTVKTTPQPTSEPLSIDQMPTPSPALPPVAPPAAAPIAPPAAASPSSQSKPPWLVMALIALVVLAGLGGAAYFVLSGRSDDSGSAAPAAVVQTTETPNPDTTQTAEAEGQLTATAQAEAEAEQAQQATATSAAAETAQAVAAASTAQAEATPTDVPATATPSPVPPTATTPAQETETDTEPASPTPTATVSPTPTRPAATPTVTATPRPAGPTVIPLQADTTVPELGETEVTDVEINPQNPREVYALVKGDGIYKSSAGGDGPWARMKLDGSGLTGLELDPTNPARLFAPSWNAVLRSDDGGNSWKAYSNGLSTANRVVDVVTVDPADPNLVYGGIGSALVVSTDGGENWVSEGYGAGLSAGRLTSIAIDPFNHDTLLVGGEFGSIYKSDDSGRTFQQLSINTGEGTYGLAAHPNKEGVYLAGVNAYDAGILQTENGADFRSASNGLIFGGADSAYSAITYAPSNPNIVYAGSGYESDGDAKGIFKSTDGGQSWEAINQGLSLNPITGYPHYVKAIAVHPTNPDILFAATGGGLYQSTNGGASWSRK